MLNGGAVVHAVLEVSTIKEAFDLFLFYFLFFMAHIYE